MKTANKNAAFLPKTFLLAALALGGGAAPDAAARHTGHADHRTSPTSYACIKNDSGWHTQMRVAYKRPNSNKWEHSPWSHATSPKKTSCVALGRAAEWREFHIYTKIAGVVWQKHGHFCFAAVRSVSEKNRDYPAYAIGKFTSKFNWRKFKTSDTCRYTPSYETQCRGCKHKDW